MAAFSGGVLQGILYDTTSGTSIVLSGVVALEFTGNATGTYYSAGVSGGTGNDIFTGLDGDDIFDGGRGDNVIDGGGGTNAATFDFSDRTSDVVLVSGGVANTTYQATVGGVAAGSVRNIQALSITGGTGNDRIGGTFTKPGAQTSMSGGDGTDTAVVDASGLLGASFSGGVAYGYLYDQTTGASISFQGIEGLEFTGNATGTSYGAGVSGGTGNDILTGLDRDDIFDGGRGDNVIDGGGGTNAATFDFSDRTSDVVLVSGGVANTTYQATVGGVAAGSVRNIQALSITGGTGNDRIGGTFTKPGAQTSMSGGDGTDTAVVDASGLLGASFSGGVAYGYLYDQTTGASISFQGIEGLEFTGNATGTYYSAGVSGGTGNDILTGLDRDDIFDGGRGDNVIDGGGGTNAATFDFSDRTSDVVLVSGGVANTTYQATVGGVAAGSVRNIQALSITGGTGNDRIGGTFTKPGAQTSMSGGDGTDTAVVDASGLLGASFSGGVAYGYLYDQTTGASISFQGIEGLEFTGNATGTSYGAGVSGGTGNDILTGLDRDDIFDGGRGDNVIDGGGGTNAATFDFSDRTSDVVLVSGGVANTTYQATVGGVAAGSVRNIQALSITGGTGNDRIGGTFTKPGAQTSMSGGDGTDTAVVDASGLAGASFSGGVAYGYLYDQTTGASISFQGIEGLEFTGNATGTYYSAGVSGGTGNDILTGLDGDDVFGGGSGGNDIIDGGGGSNNTVIFSGTLADYAIFTADGVTTVRDLRASSPSGTDKLTHIQTFRFADQSIGPGDITPPSTVPVTSSDTYTALLNGLLKIAAGNGVLANDSDSAGRQLIATVQSATAHGTLSLSSDGSFSYTPNLGFVGADSFTYTAQNGLGISEATTVGLNVVSAILSIEVPPALSPSEVGTATIHYTASAAAPANMLLLQATGAQVADPLTGAFSNSALIFIPANTADETIDVPISVKMANIPTSFAPTLSVGVADPSATIDWSSEKAALRPPGVSGSAWDRIYANFTADVGSTIGSLTQTLARDATLLNSFGINSQSGSVGLAFELEQAGDFGSLAARTVTGSFGQGWETVADVGLTIGADGTIELTGLNDFAALFSLNALTAGRFSISGAVGLSVTLDGTIFAAAAQSSIDFSFDPGGTSSSAAGFTLTSTAIGYVLSGSDGASLRFNFDGRLVTAISASGVSITASYDTAGRVTSLASSTGKALSFVRDSAGLVEKLVDTTGSSISLSYSADASQLASTDGNFGATSFAYKANTDLQTIVKPGTATATRLNYDINGRLVEIDTGSGAQTQTYLYNGTGGYQVTDGVGNTVTVALLPGGSAGRVTNTSGNVTSLLFSSQGGSLGSRDANGNTQTFTKDELGRVTSVIDANGAVSAFAYAGTGANPTSFTDATGSTRTFTYDENSHLTQTAWPDGTTRSFHYDGSGNLVSLTSRTGVAIDYAYDASGHVTYASDSSAGATAYVYDASGRLISANDHSGTTSVTYDQSGRIKKLSFSGGRSLSYEYDQAGRRTAMTDQDGHSQTYAYDSAGRLATLGTEAGTLVSYHYDAAGKLAEQSNLNDTATRYSYDVNGQIVAIKNVSPGGTTTSFEEYTYDSAGLRTSMMTQDGSWSYVYDANGQLTIANFVSTSAAVPNKSLSYTYDAGGNRLTSTEDGLITSYLTNELNEYTAVGNATFAYDAAGNMVLRSDPSGITKFGYDISNRLVSVETPSGTITAYEYDLFGNRSATVVDGVRTEFLIDPFGLGNVVAAYSGSGEWLVSYAQGLGLTAQIVASKETAFYQSDAVGSVTGVTDSTGAISGQYAYQPFGTILYTQGAVDYTYGFNGVLGISQDAAGLMYMRARDYDPGLGRFVSEDPLYFSGDAGNLYRFNVNNPVTLADPSGEGALRDFINHLSPSSSLIDPKTGEISETAVIQAYDNQQKAAHDAPAAAADVLSLYADLYLPLPDKDLVGIQLQTGERELPAFFEGLSKLKGIFEKLFGDDPKVTAPLDRKPSTPTGSQPTPSPGGALPGDHALAPTGKTGGAYGCPHFFTYDGLSFDFQGAGEFVAARSAVAGDSFEVQMRIEPEYSADSSVSIITQIAVQVGGDRVTFAADRSQSGDFVTPVNTSDFAQIIQVNGQTVAIEVGSELKLTGGSVFAISTNEYRVVLNTGEMVVVNPFGDGMGLAITLPGNAPPGAVRGFLGADEGQESDFQLQDGTVLKQPLTESQLYHEFADAWRVTDENSLLDYKQGETTATFTNPQYPRYILTLADFPPELVAQAQAIVSSAGITDPVLAANAAFDYISMGNPSFIFEDATVAKQGPASSTPTVVIEHAAPPPLIGALPTSPKILESNGSTTTATFSINLTSTALSDITVAYVVAPGVDYLGNTAGKIFFGAADFGGILPSGSVTIAVGQTSADVTVLVPNAALGAAPEKWLGISIAAESGASIYSSTAQVEIVNRSPVPGTRAKPVLKLLPTTIQGQNGNVPTLTQAGNSYTLDLGSILAGSTPSSFQFALSNVAVPGANRLLALVASATGDGFGLSGTQPSTPVLAGSSYSGMYVSPVTSELGSHTETISFSLADTNDTGFYADLPSLTLSIRETISSAGVGDSTAPVVSVTAPATVEATSSAGATVIFAGAATDNVDGTDPVTFSESGTPVTSGNTFAIGSHTVLASATDAAGNTGNKSFSFVVGDGTAPTVSVSAPSMVAAVSSSGASVSFSAIASDAVDGTDPVTFSENGEPVSSGDTFAIGSHAIVASATDRTGNTGAKSFSFNVGDSSAPMVSVTASPTVEATSSAGAVVSFDGTAADNVDGTVPVTFGENGTPVSSGNTFAIGRHTVRASATDAAGNIGAKSFSFVVGDSTAPLVTIIVPSTVAAGSSSGAAVSLSATASDAVDGTDPVIFREDGIPVSSGDTFAIGSHTIVASATDGAGNTATKSFSFSVSDSTAPVVSVSAPALIEAISSAGAAVSFSGAAMDNVDGTDPVTFSEKGTRVNSGATFAIGSHTVLASAMDAAGNTGSQSFSFVVRDDTAPTIDVTAPQKVAALLGSGAAVTFSAIASDAVDGSDPVSFRENGTLVSSGDIFAIGSHTIIASASDAAGNVGTQSFSFGINHVVSPTLTIASDQASKLEGNTGDTAFIFTVTRSGDTSGTASVTYAVGGGTADATDFGGMLPSGTISLATGETDKTFTVNVSGDTTAEPDETFNVKLSDPHGATIGLAIASATILNDDAPITTTTIGGTGQGTTTTLPGQPASTTDTGTRPGTSVTTVSTPVYRFFDSHTGTQFLTSSDSERANVLATRPDLIDEGIGLQAVVPAVGDTSATSIYRFFDTVYGTHFYTSSGTERDSILASRADLTYEGAGFAEFSTQQPSTTAVYRFFESTNGTHFYTSNADERANILNTRPDLIAEGIAFYAPSST